MPQITVAGRQISLIYQHVLVVVCRVEHQEHQITYSPEMFTNILSPLQNNSMQIKKKYLSKKLDKSDWIFNKITYQTLRTKKAFFFFWRGVSFFYVKDWTTESSRHLLVNSIFTRGIITLDLSQTKISFLKNQRQKHSMIYHTLSKPLLKLCYV